jgi:hypothetical protein
MNCVWLALILSFTGACANAEIAVLLEEPYGTFGSFNPTGHSAVYLSNVCAASPATLRRCEPGEPGVVISRYNRIGGRDWIAMPVIPFFYAVDRLEDVPIAPDRATVKALREEWRRTHLAALAPDKPGGKPPKGDWHELIGVAYSRATYAFQVETTPDADARLIEYLNSRPNRRRFSLIYRNCADFVRNLVNLYFPHALRRSVLADAGITTPKQMARCMVRYGRRHPGLELSSFFVPQVPGAQPRSKAVRHVLEAFVWSKKYVVPLAVFHPWIAASVGVAYLTGGRFNPARNVAKLPPAPPDWAHIPAEEALPPAKQARAEPAK